jgi:hypothetical protein
MLKMAKKMAGAAPRAPLFFIHLFLFASMQQSGRFAECSDLAAPFPAPKI